MSEKKLLNEREAAQLLGICRNTLLRLRTDGKLAFYRIGTQVRYSPDQIAAYLARAESAAPAQPDSRESKEAA